MSAVHLLKRSRNCVVILAVGLALNACSDKAASTDPGGPTVVNAMGTFGEANLREQIHAALQAQRIFAPAGNNAIELYIVLRSTQLKPDPVVQSALAELQPYAVIGAEQALARQDFTEADRIRQLIAAADPEAPSLARIAASIANGHAEVAEQLPEAVASHAGQAESDAKLNQSGGQDAPRQSRSVPASPTTLLGLSDLASAPPSPPSEPEARTPVLPAAQPLPASARSASELVAVSTPQPAYPSQALRAGIAGEVAVSFVVNTDGSVNSVGILSGQPKGVFDRNVVAAVERWKFRPISSPISVSRTFRFAR